MLFSTSRTIDAGGRVVMPGGVDMHTHVASTGINLARALAGDLVPAAPDTGRLYALHGYTTAVEAAVCVLSIDRGVVHQTLNHETPGEGCDLDYVKDGPREMKLAAVLSNSLGFGGHNATLAFRPVTD